MTTQTKTYSTRSNAIRAARKQWGVGAKEGLTFKLQDTINGTFSIEEIVTKAVRPEQALSTKAPKAAKVKTDAEILAEHPPQVAEKVAKVKATSAPKVKTPRPAATAGQKTRPLVLTQPKVQEFLRLITGRGMLIQDIQARMGWCGHTVRGVVSRLGAEGVNVVSQRTPNGHLYQVPVV